MTNGEMIQKAFNCEVCEPILEEDIIHVIFPDKNDSAIGFDWSWWNMEHKASTTKNNLGVDCVARQDVERYIEGFINEYTPTEELEFINLELDGLKHLPPVTPQLRKGHWMGGSYDYVCSNCEHSLNDLAQSMDYIPFSKPKYCPNCGCRMIEPKESEDT